MDAREQLLENARAALRGGRLAEGERHCREAIARWPDWPEPYTLLAAARLHAGAPGEAFEIGAAAERQGAASAELFNQLAGTRRQQGDRDGAARDYRRATDLRPEWFAPWANLGLLLQDAGRDVEADSAFAEALARDPDVAELWNNRGNIALAQGRFEDALAALGRARGLRPDWPLPHYNLGLVYEALHRFDEAAAALDACLAREPSYADARRALSAVRIRQRRHGAAVEAAAQAVALAPTAENLVALGVAHRAAGDPDAADAAFARALEAEPANAVAAWHRATLVPVLCRDAAEAAAARARVHDGLAAVAAAADPAALWPALSSATLFNAHYLGAAREDQETYGAIVARTLAAACPNLLRLPPAQRRDRPRVGFVSSLLRDHTVGELFGGCLGLDRDRFEVVLYDTGGAPDAAAERFAAAADRARHLRGDTLAIARAIRDDAPDILIYPEVGMVPHIVLLAAMRLAPLQAAGWGHPVTTGLVNVDLFLSSDAMEPADGAAHYTEDLVRLPGLSVSVAAPELAGLAPDRAALGLSPDRPVLLACQSPIKFRPQDDPVFAAIARRAPETLIAFVAHSSEHVNDRFADRLERAFREAGLDWRRHCVVVPRTDHAGWLRLNLSCDVFLDSLGWSGGMTTLEAIACGLPVVTYPGTTMRSRHTAAMLQLMGLDATIAADVDAYVDLAAALLTDPANRAAAAATIADRRATLYDDPAPVAALGDALAKHLVRRRATAERT